jgi:hypothetical protein
MHSGKRRVFKMAVVANRTGKLIVEPHIYVDKSQSKPTVKEIESYFGFDKVKPIVLSPADDKDEIKKGDCFKDWYEDELRRFYEE